MAKKAIDSRLDFIREALESGKLKASDELLVKPCPEGGYYVFCDEGGTCWKSEADLEALAEKTGATVVVCYGEGDPRSWKPDEVVRTGNG